MTPVHLSRGRARLLAAVLALALAAGALVGAAPPAAGQATPGPCPVLEGWSFQGTLSEGSMRMGSRITATGLTGRMCGLFEPTTQGVTYVATVHPSHIGLDPATSRVGLVRITTALTAPGSVRLETLAPDFGSPRPFAMSGDLDVTFGLFGYRCTARLSALQLRTAPSGSMTGEHLTNDTTGALVGRVVASEFSVPAVVASSGCPARIANLVNSIVGLPAEAGVSSFDYRVRLAPNV